MRIWPSIVKWWSERNSHARPEPIRYQAELVPVASPPHMVQSADGEGSEDILLLTPVKDDAGSAPAAKLFDPSADLDEYYLKIPSWGPLEFNTFPPDISPVPVMPRGTSHAERFNCQCALSARGRTRLYGQLFGFEVSSAMCARFRKLSRYLDETNHVEYRFDAIRALSIFICAPAVVAITVVSLPHYHLGKHGYFVFVLGFVAFTVFAMSGTLRGRNIMTILSISWVTVSAFLALLIVPGTYIFIRWRNEKLQSWQVLLITISFSVVGAILMSLVMNQAQKSSEQRLLPQYIDEDVAGAMMLDVAFKLSLLKSIRETKGENRNAVRNAADEMQRTARVIEILFTSCSRQTLASQSVTQLNSWRNLITSMIRARAGLILLPGIDYDDIIHKTVEDSRLMLDGNWSELASREAAIGASSEPVTSRLMKRGTFAATILAGAFILPYLVPHDKQSDVRKTLVVSAFFVLINASKQE